MRYDTAAELIWLPRFLQYNPPVSPHAARSWEKTLDSLPDGALKNALLLTMRRILNALSPAFQQVLPRLFENAAMSE